MIKTAFKDGSRTILSQMVKYSIAGSIAFTVDIIALFLLTEFANIHYLIAAVMAFTLGIITIYILSITWVFSTRTFSNRHHEFWIFALIGIVGLGLNELIMWTATEYANFHYMISKLISTGIVYFWNFFNRKYILFS